MPDDLVLQALVEQRASANRRPTGVRWLVLALMCLASFTAYVLRYNLSVAGPALRADLGISEVQLGLVFSGFTWAYGLCQLPGGLLGRAWGARRTLTLCLGAWAVLTVVTGVVPGPPRLAVAGSLGLLFASRLVMGLAQAPLYPITGGITIAKWFPVTSWATVNGLLTTAMTAGAAAAGPGVAWLVHALGWRTSFLVLAPIGLVVALLWWGWYRDEPAEHPAVNASEVSLIRAGRAAVEPPLRPGAWKALLRRRELLALSASYFCMNYVFYLFFNWFYYYLVEVRGLAPQVGGWFTGAQWVVGAIAATAGGWLADRLARRFGANVGYRGVVVGGLLLSAPLLWAGAAVNQPVLAVALLSLSFGATQLTDGPYWTVALRLGGAEGAAATGLMNTGGNLVGSLGAVLVPLVAGSLGWQIAITGGGLASLLAALLWIWVRADAPEAPATPAAVSG
jgi:ACS family glucarate transporter-like MFS transporter